MGLFKWIIRGKSLKKRQSASDVFNKYPIILTFKEFKNIIIRDHGVKADCLIFDFNGTHIHYEMLKAVQDSENYIEHIKRYMYEDYLTKVAYEI